MAIIWLSILGIAVLLNFIMTDFVFLGISIGALIAIVLDFLSISTEMQIINFGLIAIFITVVFYPKIKKKLKENPIVIKSLEEKYIGMEFTLNRDVDGETLISFKGSYWTFKNKGIPLKEGEEVIITSTEGNKLIIDKVNPFRLKQH